MESFSLGSLMVQAHGIYLGHTLSERWAFCSYLALSEGGRMQPKKIRCWPCISGEQEEKLLRSSALLPGSSLLVR